MLHWLPIRSGEFKMYFTHSPLSFPINCDQELLFWRKKKASFQFFLIVYTRKYWQFTCLMVNECTISRDSQVFSVDQIMKTRFKLDHFCRIELTSCKDNAVMWQQLSVGLQAASGSDVLSRFDHLGASQSNFLNLVKLPRLCYLNSSVKERPSIPWKMLITCLHASILD